MSIVIDMDYTGSLVPFSAKTIKETLIQGRNMSVRLHTLSLASSPPLHLLWQPPIFRQAAVSKMSCF